MSALENKTYRNLLKEIGIPDDEIKARIKEAVQIFFYDENERIYHEADTDMGYLTDTGNNDARTEGMSYGMMLCVQLDMKEEFDRIWKWSKTYMFMDKGDNEGYFAWSCQTDGTKNADGPAPDGEEFYAMALFFASHRWGDGEGIFEYSKEARNILSACLHKGENGRVGCPMWNHENGQILFVPGIDFTDPSYHLPHFYELFALWANEEDRDFFKRAAKVSREYLAKACHKDTGLSAEYANFDGTPLDKQLPWGYFGNFFSDAYRTAANIGLDSVWFSEDCGQLEVPLKMMKFFGTDLEAVRCEYKVDGTPTERPVLHPLGLLSTIAQGALVAKTDEEMELATKWVKWFWNQPLRKGVRRYYDNCLYMFALLALSGNYRIW
ncbi:glycosyl hydrolase family 8 [Butyrivibrio sp. YAB3001]|uniref:glycosyl hydrolase family 8 n=1 Tax=Butyrivibrio sp. YAB3001 TaxID=1520812 RepID=UPI0008F6296D|nr:glycosyl hydrolase family 8 [Butyrivibrio sp. YAB3001]SFB68303.1 oligosaccharide reducing-end xylanase [Butyrivibrio sp. YAB3001]